MRRRTSPALLLLAALAAPATAEQPVAPPATALAAPATASDEAARPILGRLLAATTSAERSAAATELGKLDPVPIAILAEFLARTRSSSELDRRAALAAIGADLPDDKGKFRAPGRQTELDEKANDALDWLGKLVDLDARTPGVADVIADVAAIRALSTSRDPAAAAVILEFAFRPDGVAYRDECGRTLRRMAPWSLPALLRGSEKTGDGSLMRYANYQLERLDRQNPRKALADAPNDELKVAVLEAFKDSLHREGVFVVLDTVDDGSPVVRSAARVAWMEYATGRRPPDAPKEKLQLPGGKLADKPTPLWLTSRELADIALRRRLEELTGQAPDPKATLGPLSEQLFALHDQRRVDALGADLDVALALARDGKTAEAAIACDRILVQVPDLARRAETAPIYLALGDAMAAEARWREAAAAFGKAAAMAGASELGASALARHHEARGKAAEAKGQSGEVEFARAREIDADQARREASGDRTWMLYAGIGVGLAGIALLLGGWALRRR